MEERTLGDYGAVITQLLHWNSTTVELELKPFLDISAFENYSVDKLGLLLLNSVNSVPL